MFPRFAYTRRQRMSKDRPTATDVTILKDYDLPTIQIDPSSEHWKEYFRWRLEQMSGTRAYRFFWKSGESTLIEGVDSWCEALTQLARRFGISPLDVLDDMKPSPDGWEEVKNEVRKDQPSNDPDRRGARDPILSYR
jgi:hypothetical protein